MKKINNVHIIGMGALGMLYGNMIVKSLGAEHVSYIMDDDRYERYKDASHLVNGEPAIFPKLRVADAAPADLVIVAVKYPGLAGALETMKNSVGEDTLIISVMNGISSEEIIGERYGHDRIIHTIAQEMDAMHFGADLTYSRSGRLCIGILKPDMQEKLDTLVEFFTRANMAYQIEDDILYRMWGKFMTNVGVNQVCMVYDTNYAGAMSMGSEACAILYSAMREVILLANAEGVSLTEADLNHYIKILRSLSPDATPSMGQDRIKRNPSEVEAFAGTVIRLAEKHGLPVPTNEFLYQRVKAIEAEY